MQSSRCRQGAAAFRPLASGATYPMRWWSPCRPRFRRRRSTPWRAGTGSCACKRKASASPAPPSTAGGSPMRVRCQTSFARSKPTAACGRRSRTTASPCSKAPPRPARPGRCSNMPWTSSTLHKPTGWRPAPRASSPSSIPASTAPIRKSPPRSRTASTPSIPRPRPTTTAPPSPARSPRMRSSPAWRRRRASWRSAHSAKSESTTLAILKGIDWAVARGARVINMSFAGPQDPEIARALAAARRKGVLLVAAAGNAGPQSPPLYPAADPNVIAVTATDADDRLLKVANRGRHIALAAPGVDIVLPATGGGYQVSSGTSVAAAHVSGIAALLLELKPGLAPDAARKILQSTARGPRTQGPRRSIRGGRCQRLSRGSLAASRGDAGCRFDRAVRPMPIRRLNPNGIWRARGDRPGSSAPCR